MMRDELLDTLRRSFDGDAWHGPALREVLADISAEEAGYRVAPTVHNIWEITLHIAAWAHEVARRLKGAAPAEPAEGDWPAPGNMDKDGWEDTVQQVFNSREAVLGVVRELAETDLSKRSGTAQDAAVAGGFSYGGLIEGLAQHNAYHAGQIMLLKRVMRAP